MPVTPDLLVLISEAETADFLARVRCALIYTALAVKKESAATNNHSDRAILAHAVLQESHRYAAMFAPVLRTASYETTLVNVTNALLASTAASNWNQLATEQGIAAP